MIYFLSCYILLLVVTYIPGNGQPYLEPAFSFHALVGLYVRLCLDN